MLDSIGDSLTLTAGKYPRKTALKNYGGESLTYSHLNERVNRLANAMRDLGIKKGDKVAYLLFNCSQFVEIHYAVAKAGAVGVPLNFRLTGRELSYQLKNSDSVILFCGPELLETVNAIRGDTEVKHYICTEGGLGYMDYEKLLAKGSSKELGMDINLYDNCVIMYTSGTTGFPKGAILTHRNCLFNAMNNVMSFGYLHSDIMQIIPPLFHAGSLNGAMIHTVLLGMTAIIHKQFSAKEALQAIQEEKITITWGPATIFRALLMEQEAGGFDVSTIRLLINGGMAMPAEMKMKVLQCFPGATLSDTYGLTEACPNCTNLQGEDVLRKTGSVGLPLPLSDVKIFDHNGRELAAGQVGEIVTRGNFMKGYYNNDQATLESVKNGWLHTGDLGMKDDEGFVSLVDRKKDMISPGGENVYSREVEEIIALHPDVYEVAVIGLPDEKWGESVAAVIVPKPGKQIDEKELIQFCRKSLAGYKCPRTIKYEGDLPKTPSGKILKRVLIEKYKSQKQ
ncbi:MAG: acyl-CoA synthetase [Syntrophales bacterium]